MPVRDTSIEAFRTIRDNGLLSKRRMQVYEYLFKHGPCDARSMAEALAKEHGVKVDSFQPRIAELIRVGVVSKVGEVSNPKTGHTVEVFDVTSALPVKFYRDSLKQKLAGLGISKLEDYYTCDHWIRFKTWYFSQHAKTCFVSGVGTDIQLHHITYERVGEESVGDVVPLAGFWHQFVHHLIRHRGAKLLTAHFVAKDTFVALGQCAGTWDQFTVAFAEAYGLKVR
jgi:hypothetical protein